MLKDSLVNHQNPHRNSFADQTPNPLGTDISNPPTVTDMGSASEITTPYESNKLEKEDQIQEIVEWKADPKTSRV